MVLKINKNMLVIAVGALFAGMIMGCAGLEYKQGIGLVPVELRDADRAVEAARMAGKNTECPEDFAKAERMRDNAYETHLGCNTPEGKRIAGEAVAMAEGLCPRKAVAAPLDSDRDGVADNLDKCPGTPSGVAVDRNGCPLDSDNDGVYDYLDKCPGTPAGAPVDKNGCPLDSDGDGVYDYLDKCPGTLKGIQVDAQGCPVPIKERVSIELRVEFALNSAVVKNVYHEHVQKVANFLKTYPDTRAEIAGHTDSTGDAAYNLSLSQKRAVNVMKHLIDFGIDPKRLKAVGYGETMPIADNKTKEGRQKNRRVEAGIETVVTK